MGRTYQSTVVEAPADDVWETLRDFHDLSWAPEVVESCEALGDARGDEPGARRLLNGAFEETLLELSDVDRRLRYSIDDGPSPVSSAEVSNYVGTVRVHPVTDVDASFVEWSSRWDGNDREAEEFCHGIYVGLLQALSDHFGG